MLLSGIWGLQTQRQICTRTTQRPHKVIELTVRWVQHNPRCTVGRLYVVDASGLLGTNPNQYEGGGGVAVRCRADKGIAAIRGW